MTTLLLQIMNRPFIAMLLPLLLAVLALIPSNSGARDLENIELPDGSSASIKDMSWLSGPWQTTFGADGTILEENWAMPRAQMLGAFLRYMKNGKVVALESITFAQRDGAMVQRMRQFDLDFNPTIPTCAEKMISHINNEFTFETTNGCPIKRVVYKYADNTFYLKLNDAPFISFKRR